MFAPARYSRSASADKHWNVGEPAAATDEILDEGASPRVSQPDDYLRIAAKVEKALERERPLEDVDSMLLWLEQIIEVRILRSDSCAIISYECCH